MIDEAGKYGGMRPFDDVLPFEEAARRIRDTARPVSRVDTVDLARAAQRVLAMDVPAPFDVPGFDRSAMDGYAVQQSALASATEVVVQPSGFGVAAEYSKPALYTSGGVGAARNPSIAAVARPLVSQAPRV